jgi:hypothetical protein|nr:MAG TPA: hypothetical protein [Caudoviricetes sp.]
MTRVIEPLNVTGDQFCVALGLPKRYDIMQQLRDLGLVKFFMIGKKYMYPRTYIDAVQQLLVNGKIQIRTDKGEYYIVLIKKAPLAGEAYV